MKSRATRDRIRVPTGPFIVNVAIPIWGDGYSTGLRTCSKNGRKNMAADQCIVTCADGSHSRAQETSTSI